MYRSLCDMCNDVHSYSRMLAQTVAAVAAVSAVAFFGENKARVNSIILMNFLAVVPLCKYKACFTCDS